MYTLSVVSHERDLLSSVSLFLCVARAASVEATMYDSIASIVQVASTRIRLPEHVYETRKALPEEP